jgi:hypothetical protein
MKLIITWITKRRMESTPNKTTKVIRRKANMTSRMGTREERIIRRRGQPMNP